MEDAELEVLQEERVAVPRTRPVVVVGGGLGGLVRAEAVVDVVAHS